MFRIIYDSRGYVADVNDSGVTPARRKEIAAAGGRIETRNDWPTLEHARRAAEVAMHATGEEFFAVDNGPHMSPRFDIARMPQIGDEVSRGFNGDYYPEGKITHNSPSRAVIKTSTSEKFTRRKRGAKSVKNSAVWRDRGGTFTLIRGHHDKRNPHF